MPDFAATRGSDTFAGGAASRDKVDFHQPGATRGVEVDLNVSGPQNTYGSGTDTFTSIEDLTGTDFIDVLTGNGSSNTLLGMGGGDILDAGSAGTDRLEGGDGDDTLNVSYTGGGHADLYGGAGYDTFNIHLGLAAGQSVTAFGGDGDDRFNLDAKGPVILSLGAGRDTVSLAAGQTGSVLIVDFKAGDQGDVLDLYAWLAALPTGWDRSDNPFNSIARLSYANGSTTLQVFNGGWKDAVVLQGVRAADLTAYNLGGFPPDGTAAPGEYLANSYAVGTVGDDYLVGASSSGIFTDNHLSGGAGNDVLDGGPGGVDQLTGGAGADTFVIRRGYGPEFSNTIIEDFVPGTDRIVVHNASAIVWHYDQPGGNLELRFDNDHTVTLVGLNWSDSLLNSFTFEGPVQVTVPTLPPPGATGSVTFVGDEALTIAAGTQLYHTSTYGDFSDATITLQSARSQLELKGTVFADGGNGAIGISSVGQMPMDMALRTAHVHIATGAQVLVDGGQGSAYGYYTYIGDFRGLPGGGSLTNDGLIEVVSGGWAAGVYATRLSDGPGIVNNGTITVYSGMTAFGVRMEYGDFVNTGSIAAYGSRGQGMYLEAAGVFINSLKTFTNSGTITAQSHSLCAAVEFGYSGGATIFNSGTLTGDYAIYSDDMGANGSFGTNSLDHVENLATGVMNGTVFLNTAADVLGNAGHINGNIDMGDGDDSLVNSGVIAGEVDLGAGNDTYGGASGLDDDGGIYAGDGNDSVTSGAGSQYIFGEDGDDTLKGGDGDDWIDGGAGSDMLDGGAGYDVLSYRSQTFGVNVDLGAGAVTSAKGTDHVAGFEGVIGTAAADVMAGGATDDDLRGENGDDTLGGGAGSDVLVGGRGADTLSGGAGKDIFVYDAFDGADVITDFTPGQDTILIGGYFTAPVLSQDGADTLMTFADGGTIRVRNVLPAAFQTNDILFGDSSTESLAADPGTPRINSGTTVYFNADLKVTAGETYIVSDQRYGFANLGDLPSGAYGHTLDNAGTISVSYLGGAAGVAEAGFINQAGGVLVVTSTGVPAPNLQGSDAAFWANQRVCGVQNPQGPVDNRGLIKVSSASVGAWGIDSEYSGTPVTNSGRIEVRSGSFAVGVVAWGATTITNTGTIIVEASTQAYGIADDDFGGSSNHVINSGLIQACVTPGTDTPNFSPSVGINLSDKSVIDNSGTISAEQAIVARDLLTVNNTGTITGDIYVMGAATIINSGTLTGDILAHDQDDLFDASTGTFKGTFYGDDGNDYVYAGTKGEVIDGGTGIDTVDFSRFTAGVTVSVSGVNAVAGFGIHTFSNVENLIGSAFGDNLSGDGGHNTLTGGKGDDTLTGGAGGDYFVYGIGDGHDVITDFTVGGAQHDTIDVSAAGYTAWQQLLQVGADTKVMFSSSDWILLKNVQASSLTAGDFHFKTEDVDRTLTGTAGDDILTGHGQLPYGGIDTLDGGDGNDVLTGGYRRNHISGGAGDDYIYIFSGLNEIDGGDGNDTLDYSLSTEGIRFDGSVPFGYAALTRSVDQFDLVTSIENVVGTVAKDTIVGFDGNNRLYGLAGDDGLDGNAGDDVLEGGTGNDTLFGAAGDDVLEGGTGNDFLTGGYGADTYVFGLGDGQDEIRPNGWIDPSPVDRILFGAGIGTADVKVRCDADGNLVLTVGAGGDSIQADDYFNDPAVRVQQVMFADGTIWSQADIRARLPVPTEGDDTLSYGAGNDVVHALGGRDTVTGGLGNDQIYGDGGDDNLNGKDGNDYIDGGAGADTMYGDIGDDTFVVDNAGDIVVEEYLGVNVGGEDMVLSSLSYHLGYAVDDLTLTGTNAINGTGNELSNVLFGNAAANVLDGLGGGDSLWGGAGDDTYIVDRNDDQANELAGEGTDTVWASSEFALRDNVENLVLTGIGNIDGWGNALNNVLTGNAGNNILTGYGGNDTYVLNNPGDVVVEAFNGGTDTVIVPFSFSVASIYVENITLTGSLFLSATGNGLNNILTGNRGNNILNGNVGADTMIGGAGSDYYYVDNAGDVVTENAGEGTDMVYALISYSLGANVENVTLLGTGNLDATGNELNNFLFGTSGNNNLNAGAGADYIFALGGNDVLDGGAGADGMYGGAGNDTYYVDNFADLCNEQSTGTGIDDGGTDLVISSANFQLSGFIENLTLTGMAVVGAGNASNNIILGNASGNYLFGLAGTDTLNGGAGNDALYGGGGADTFVFSTGSGFDVIGDFSAAEGDTINLHAYATGVVNGAGIVITASGGSTYVNMGGGNVIFVANASVSDVSSHIVW